MDEEFLGCDFAAIFITAIQVEAFWFIDFYERKQEKIFFNYGAGDKPIDGKVLVARDLPVRLMEFTSCERAQVKSLLERTCNDATFKQLALFHFRTIEISLKDGFNFVIFEPLSDANMTTTTGLLNELAENLFSHDAAHSTYLAKTLALLDNVSDLRIKLDSFQMPKFKFENDIDLKPVLESVGLVLLFDSHRAQIFNIMNLPVHISEIMHKDVIETTKIGIKASGVTMMKKVFQSKRRYTRIKIAIENPFMFVIRHQKIPLFLGQLTHL